MKPNIHRTFVILWLFSIIVFTLSAGAMTTGVTAADVSAQPISDCGDGPDGGAAYAADLGLTVIDDTDLPPPADGPFVNESSLRFGNVTLSAEGQASLHLENATAPTVCLNNLDAPFVPVRLSIDDTITVLLEGQAGSFAIGPINYDPDATASDLAYVSNESLTVRVPTTGLEPDTTIRAVSVDSESVITEATVDEDGAVSFEFPAMRAEVDLRTTSTPTPIVVTGANQTVTAETNATGTTPPGTSSAVGNQTTVPDQPGFGIALTVGVLFAMLLLAGRRHQS